MFVKWGQRSQAGVFSPLAPGRSVWCIPAHHWAAVHRKDRRRGRCASHEEVGFDSSRPLFFRSTRGRMGWMHVWVEPHLNKILPRSPAKAGRMAHEHDTWDIHALVPPFHLALRHGCPSCGSRERDRSLGRPRAASRLLCPSAACWERQGCWSPQDTGDERRSALAGVPPGVWWWGCGTVPQPFAIRESLHRDRSENRPLTLESHSPPTERAKRRELNYYIFKHIF